MVDDSRIHCLKSTTKAKKKLIFCFSGTFLKNKRAQRALGRSPEENVKGQGEAIYRGPLMLSTKYW